MVEEALWRLALKAEAQFVSHRSFFLFQRNPRAPIRSPLQIGTQSVCHRRLFLAVDTTRGRHPFSF